MPNGLEGLQLGFFYNQNIEWTRLPRGLEINFWKRRKIYCPINLEQEPARAREGADLQAVPTAETTELASHASSPGVVVEIEAFGSPETSAAVECRGCEAERCKGLLAGGNIRPLFKAVVKALAPTDFLTL